MTQLFDHNDLNTEQQTYTTKQTLLHGTNTILDVLKSTLGPSGNLKFLKDTVTNDGACILKNLLIDSPSASLLIKTSISQDKEEGDGTTSVALLSALLYKEAQINIHPLKIIKGYTIALNHIISSIQNIKVESNKFNLAKTTLNSKILNTDLFANICVKASAIDKQHINIIKVPGKLEDSYFDDGFILNRDVDINIENARVLIANTSLDYDKIKIFGAKIQVSSVGELSKLEEAEKDRMRQKIKNICTEGEEVVIDVFLNRQLIYDFPKLEFRKYNVTAIEHCDFSGIENLSKIIGSKILSTFENKEIGICEKIESVRIGDKNMVRFKGKKEAGTIVLFGSKEILEEGERSIHDALCVLRECEMICGGGSVEAYMAHELNNLAKNIEGPESEGVYAFARALMEIPKILADNCGFDGDALKSKLRSAYEKGTVNIGVDLDSGDLGCMKTKGVYESLRMKKSVFVKATETAQMLIKCDGFVKCKPRERGRA